MKTLQSLFPFFLFTCFFLVFFNHQIFFDEVFYCCDNLLINVPAKIFWVKNILSGKIPFINPFLFSGSPFLADINVSTLYPGNIFFMLLEPFYALTISTLFHVLLTSGGMFWLSLRLGLKKTTALIVSTTYTFSGTVIGYTGNLPMIQVASFLPLIFGSWIVFADKPTKKYFILIIVFSSLQVLAGHIQLTYYSFVFCLLYGLFFINRPLRSRLVFLFVIVFFIGLITAVQLLPFFDFARHTTRIGAGFSYAVFGGLPLAAIARLFFPSIVGNVSIGTDWWQGGSMYGYIGIIPIFLLLGSVPRAGKKEYFFLGTGIISFLAAFGASTPIFALLYYAIPGVGLFRVPSHFFLITTLCFSILVGISFEKKVIFTRVLLIMCGGLILTWVGLVLGKDMIMNQLYLFDNPKIFSKLEFIGTAGLHNLFKDVTNNILFIVVCFFVFYIWVKYINKGLWIITGGLIFVDLFIYSRMNLLTIPYQTMKMWETEQQNIVSEIQAHVSPEYRFYVHPSLYPSQYKRVFGETWMQREIYWQMRTFRPNTLMNYEVPIVDGYASMIDSRYQQLFGVTAKDPTGVTIPDTAVDQLRKFGVRYILLPEPPGNTEMLPSVRILWKNEYMGMYELPGASKILIPKYSEHSMLFSIGLVLTLAGIAGIVILPKSIFSATRMKLH